MRTFYFRHTCGGRREKRLSDVLADQARERQRQAGGDHKSEEYRLSPSRTQAIERNPQARDEAETKIS